MGTFAHDLPPGGREAAPLLDRVRQSRFWAGRREWLLLALVAELLLLVAAGPFSSFAAGGNTLRFVPLMLAAGGCFVAAAWLFSRVRPLRAGAWLWGGAVLIRCVCLPMEPGDDFWRYVWEGRIQAAGFNPYEVSPDAPGLAALRDASWAKINHPDTPAIYPPATEWLFHRLVRISSSTLFFKAVFAAADLAVVGMLLALIGGDRSVHAAAWYAWNPAVAYACAGGGHFDSIMLALITAALLALHRSEAASSRPGLPLQALSAGLLGLAIAVKLAPVFLVPAWALALRKRFWLLTLAAAIPALSTFAYGGPAVVLGPLRSFADIARFNDLFWWAVEAVSIRNPWQRNWPFSLALAVAVVVITIRFQNDWRRAALWLLGAALILSPVLHPWYATWILPIACWRGVYSWTMLSLSALAAYLLWDSVPPLWTAWHENALTHSLVVLPVGVAWWIERKRQLLLSYST